MSTQAADFPDFFRGDQWGNPVPFVDEVNVMHNNAVQTFGPFYMAGWEALQVYVNAAAPGVPVFVLQWWADASLTVQVGTHSFVTIGGVPFINCYSGLGPWLTISAQYLTGAGTVLTSTIVTPRRGVHGDGRGIRDAVLLSGSAHILSGTTATATPVITTPGRGTLCVVGGGGAHSSILSMAGVAGGHASPVAALTVGALGIEQTTVVSLPAYPLQLAITNADAAAQDFVFSLVLDTAW